MADDLSDLEIAVLCDLLQGPDVNLKAYKRTTTQAACTNRTRR